ncbi:hypothetical protein LPJ66_004650 [Kickxella alabastrina]|uniref:Uncharacterized protein n=1 Tax=Kickxella alabastrina TaxID=61397 RepID=A0ACC1IL32_9FUNG|nr:hypothetical protein LPJ66_004650 [Kickxella alabastrina]
MTAKPIIDIQVVVINFNNLRSCVTGLRSLRYAYKGECNIAGREYFKKPGYHIHMMQINNAEYTRKKLFVQYLRDNEDAHIEYVNLKRQLANKWAGHREGQYKYTSDKTDFIMGILRKAGWQQ